MVTKEQIHAALESVQEPELKFSIIKLGMIEGVEISNGEAQVSLKLPLPDSPGEEGLRKSIARVIGDLEGINEVKIITTVMSDSERLDLANRMHHRPASGKSAGSAGSKAAEKALSNSAPLALNEDSTIAETDPQRKQVGEALSRIDDPEIHRPLTELGMVKSIGIADGDVALEILLTIPGCPLKDKITGDITTELKKYDWVNEVVVQFDVMTDEQRQRVAQMVRSGGGGEPAAWKKKVNVAELAKRIIVVCSGKGGVGKSTTTTNLAFAMANIGYKVGILDADVYGFSIPRMSGIHGQPKVEEDQIEPLQKGNIQIMSMGYFVDEDSPVIWRGPLLHKAINQFLADVAWEEMDYLFIDLPPGTGDVTLTIATALPTAEMLIVTTPQPVATHVAGRVAKLAERTKLSLLGVIENMSYYEVDGRKERIFGEGGGKELAERLNTPFLGEIPLGQEIRERADRGNPITSSRDSALATTYYEIAEKITNVKAPLISA